jgi:TonB-linked SusC/RagA family outer membrane protein
VRARRFPLGGALLALATIALAAPRVTAQQAARGGALIRGTVTDEGTKAPLSGVTVSVVGTRHAVSTNESGQYVLVGVPAGTFSIEARRLGYGLGRRDNVRVSGDTLRVDFALNSNPLSLEAVTVSATMDPTSGIKSPYAVNSISSEMMPVPATAAASTMLVGKVAGVNIIQASGAPGSGSYLQLRAPSSIEKDNGPLFVVDGVMLNDRQSVTTQDIEAMNIESIEVIKGAAAAALYGSRAAGGVISIKTQRGKGLSLGQSVLTIRNDFGMDQYYDKPKQRMHHWFRMDDQGHFLNSSGQIVPRANRNSQAIDDDGMADNPYPVTYDNIGALFRNGQSLQTTVSIAQNSASTNYMLSFTRNRQPGLIVDTYGYQRQSVQFTLDHALRDNITVGVSANHTRGNSVPDAVSFGGLYSYDIDVDLAAKDANGFYYSRPDSASTLTNPLYLKQVSDNNTRRSRTLINGTASFRPFDWLTLNGDVGYDRGDRVVDNFTPPGLPDSDGAGVTLGSLSYLEDEVDGLTATAGATALRSFGALTTRLTARGEMQRERNLFFQATGTDFRIAGVRDLAGAGSQTNTSSLTDTRTNAGMAALGLDYDGKYILDMLLRREGSSLFGPGHRWNNFYRIGGSYVVSDESWWPTSGVFGALSTFKLRYNVGTAGTRPAFADQYANISVVNGSFVRGELGNPELHPEVKTDHEAGIDMIVKNRLQVLLTYAKSKTKDAIVGIAAPSKTGYNTMNANVGVTSGESYELTLEGTVLERGRLRWSSNLVLDRTKSTVNTLGRPCYGDGARYYCDGSPLTAFWGYKFVHDVDHLRQLHASSHDQFDVNDEGLVVPVGTGNTWRDGLAKNLWGTTVNIDGVTYRWGEPILEWDEQLGGAKFQQIGNGEPKFRFGLGNRFNYKDFQLYFLLSGQVGGQVYNDTKRYLIGNLDHPDVDQYGKSDETKKPYYYYSRGLGQATYQDIYVESGTFAKLYEVQLGYNITRQKLPILSKAGAERVSLQLIGRNLLTWTNYSGWRVDGGSPNYRVDATDYPIARNFTGSVTLVF